MLLATLPLELMYVLIDFLNIRDIRILNKIDDLCEYRPIFKKFIDKDMNNTADFNVYNYYKSATDNIRLDLCKLHGEGKIYFESNPERRNIYLINVYKDKIDFYKNFVQKIDNRSQNIVILIKEYLKIVNCMIKKYGRKGGHFVSPFKIKPTIDEYMQFKLNSRKQITV